MAQTSKITNVVAETSGAIDTTAQTSKITNVVAETSGVIKTTAQISKINNVVIEVSGTIQQYALTWLPQYAGAAYTQQPPTVGRVQQNSFFAPGSTSSTPTYAVVCIN